MRTLQEELLKRCIKNNISHIYTHLGWCNNANLTTGEREYLHELARNMASKDYGWVIDGVMIHPTYDSYDGDTVLSGLALRKIKEEE